jgi:hypothetical protein
VRDVEIGEGMLEWDALSPCERAGECVVAVDEPCPHMLARVT